MTAKPSRRGNRVLAALCGAAVGLLSSPLVAQDDDTRGLKRVDPDAPRQIETLKDCADCPTMVIVPGGLFVAAGGASMPIRAFAMSQSEVTRGEYRRFVNITQQWPGGNCVVDAGGGRFAPVPEKNWRDTNFSQSDRDPVVCLSWREAAAYAEWLSAETGLRYRLPFEREWEYAARAGTQTAGFWGDDPGQACRFANVADVSFARKYPGAPHHACDDGFLFTAPVGAFEANPFGLFDMVGNAWEWVADCWSPQIQSGAAGAVQVSGCAKHVIKGGAWALGPDANRTGFRLGGNDERRMVMNGFRVVRALTDR